MSDSEGKGISIKLPGEWALQKAFGPVLAEMGEDLKRLYAKGRDMILSAGYRKIPNPEDGRKANLRVTRDVLWNGAFTDDEVCAEYFGGILAASRSDDGNDDSTIYYVDVIKSLSSGQLRLHYLIYNCLNKILVAKNDSVNVAKSAEIQSKTIWLATNELKTVYGINFEFDFNILWRQGLINEYKIDVAFEGTRGLPYGMAKATSFGVTLYAAAFNRLDEWRVFPAVDFGNFASVTPPRVFADSLSELKTLAGLAQPKNPDAMAAGAAPNALRDC